LNMNSPNRRPLKRRSTYLGALPTQTRSPLPDAGPGPGPGAKDDDDHEDDAAGLTSSSFFAQSAPCSPLVGAAAHLVSEDEEAASFMFWRSL
jgi:hypothetical protein